RSKWAQAMDRLRCVRYALHLLAERAEDRLLFDFQPRLANLFGHAPTPGSNESIEQFMLEYFRATARISLLGERIVARVQQRLRPAQSEALEPGWQRSDNRLELTNTRKPLQPLGLVHGLQWLIRRPELSAIGPEAARAIDRLLAAHSRALQGPVSRGVLMELLQGSASPMRVLRLWARHGILGAMIPAFARITGRMQYDLFHVYTVDRHTLSLIEQLALLRQDRGPEDLAQPMRIQRRIDKPHLLYLAGLFHDIAKGRGGDHSRLGAVEVRRFARALDLPTEDRELLSFLVRQHLAMSITAQKQDLHDPATIARFAKLVEQPRRLDYLYLLTVADIRATNPKLWNGWKARLLGDLHSFTEQHLRSEQMTLSTPGKAARIRREAMEVLRGEGFGRDQLLTLWQDFPPECFQRQSVDQLRWQSGALLRANRGDDKPLAAVRRIGSTGAREIFVYTRDQDGIFATLAALLDRMHLAVVGARILTSPAGWAMDSFQVVDLDTRWTDSMSRNIEIQMRLELALAESPLKPKMAKKNLSRQQKHFYFPPEINLRALESGNESELALACSDQPGLLTRVALALLSCRVNVHTARIATFGERVEDRFVLSNEQGRALTKAQARELTKALAEQLVSEDG
ncbi:MAG: HD domain-containing protein, partial [Xanthomonadales bacterium]|nr:HD domain-containing protein [Xanthomonadales bacterium]